MVGTLPPRFPPYRNSIARACYAVGGMPLAFTQEHFLVRNFFKMTVHCRICFVILTGNHYKTYWVVRIGYSSGKVKKQCFFKFDRGRGKSFVLGRRWRYSLDRGGPTLVQRIHWIQNTMKTQTNSFFPENVSLDLLFANWIKRMFFSFGWTQNNK